jgi:hypothetical protein
MYRIIFFISLFSLGVSHPSHAQNTFNKRFRFDYLAAVLTSVVATDSCYYATGVIADTIFPPLRVGNLFVKFDLDGNVVFQKALTGPGRHYETWANTLIPLEDGGFVLSGYTIDTLMRAIFIRYNAEGDTLFTKEYFNTNYPLKDYLRPYDMKQTPDGGFVLANWFGTPTVGDTEVSVLKIDSQGNEQWHKIYGTPLRERPESILVAQNGDIIVGALRNNTNMVNNNYIFTTWIMGLNGEGDMVWSYFSPYGELRGAANDMVLLDDGSLLVASGVGTERFSTSVNQVFFEKYLMKLNPAPYNIEWDLEFNGQHPSSLTKMSNLIMTNGGNNFVAAGTSYHQISVPGPFGWENTWTTKGWLAKGTLSGEVEWEREYLFFENQQNKHTIYSIKETEDLGFIIAGESRDGSYQAEYPQQGWLLKLDEHGCLVPGCQLVNSEEIFIEKPELAIFPNPASDFLNFYLRSPAGENQEGAFRIVDMSGKEILRYDRVSSGATFIVPVASYPSGTYVLQYLENGVVKTSKLFIVQ